MKKGKSSGAKGALNTSLSELYENVKGGNGWPAIPSFDVFVEFAERCIEGAFCPTTFPFLHDRDPCSVVMRET